MIEIKHKFEGVRHMRLCYYRFLSIFFVMIFCAFSESNNIIKWVDSQININENSKSNSIYKNRKFKSNNMTLNSVSNDEIISFTEYEYENNNNFIDSNPILGDSYYMYDEYSVVVNGSLTRRASMEDYDYYHFKIDRKAHVTINLEFEQSASCEFYVYDFDNYISTDKTYLYRIENPVYWLRSGNRFIDYEGDFKPGTYFIIIKSVFGNSTINSFVNYDLTFTVEKEQVQSPVDLYDLKVNKGIGAVAWINDLLPGNISPFYLLSHDLRIYDSSFGGENTRDFIYDDFKNISNGVPAFTLYLLNRETKEEFNVFFNALMEICEEFAERNTYLNEISFSIKENSDVVFNAIDSALNIIEVVLPKASTLISLIASLGKVVVNAISESFLPQNEANIVVFRDLCRTVSSALSFAVSSDELFKLDFKYSVYEKNGNVYVSYIPTQNQSIDLSNEYIVTGREVSYCKGVWYGYGNIYQLFNWNDFNSSTPEDENPLLNLSLLEEVADAQDIMPSCTNLISNYVNATEITEGDYKWFKFTASEEKVYYFISHGIGANNLEIDLCSNIFPGYYNNDLIIRTYSGGYKAKNNPNDVGTIFYYYLLEGDTIYLRVHASNFSKIEEQIAVYITETYPEEIEHEHSYTYNYVFFNMDKHYSFCECGDSILNFHSARPYVINDTPPYRIGHRCEKCNSICNSTIGSIIKDPPIIVFKDRNLINQQNRINQYNRNVIYVN